MNNNTGAKSYVKKAEVLYRQVLDSYEHKEWYRVVRLSQECSEMAAKALLRFMGIDYPKWHKTGDVIKSSLSGAKVLTDEDLNTLATYMDDLAQDRERAFYGEEREDEYIPAYDLFDQGSADEAMEKAKWVLEKVKTLIR